MTGRGARRLSNSGGVVPMASKDLKPGRRLGNSHPRRTRIVVWSVGLLVFGSGLYAAYHFGTTTKVEVAVARVRRTDFVVSARARGDIKSTKSFLLKAPQTPGLKIVRLLATGTAVRKGDVVVEFDPAQHEQDVISQTVQVGSIESSIEQLKASQKMAEGLDVLSKMQSEYDVERAKLDASKAEVISPIDGQKFHINVYVKEGSLHQVNSSITAHEVGNEADLLRLDQRKDKAVRDLETHTGYLSNMQVRAPADGVVNLLPNFRSRGSFGRAMPPFKAGDDVWAGAEIAEIPDLSSLYIDLKLEETERGKTQLGQAVRVHVDAVPGQDFPAEIDFINPIALLVFKGGSTPDKQFPARATLKSADPRLRPGMSASAEIIIEREANMLLIPIRSTFSTTDGPAVYVQIGDEFVVRQVQVGRRNDDDIIVTGGLKEGEIVTLESPAEAAKRAKKKG